MCKVFLSFFCFLLSIVCVLSPKYAFTQYPDKYLHYRHIPTNCTEWDCALRFYQMENIDSALRYAAKAEQLFSEQKDWEAYLFINNFRAQLLGESRRPKEAILELSNARDFTKTFIDTLSSIEFAENLFLSGRIYTLLNDYSSSEVFFKRTALLLEQTKRYPEVLALAYHLLFKLNDNLMRGSVAQVYLLRAINTVRGSNSDYAKAICYHIQAEGLDKGQPQLKTDFYKAAIQAFEEGGFLVDYYYYYSLLMLSVQFSTYHPNYENALLYINKAQDYAIRNHLSQAKLYGLYLAIADTYRSFGEYHKALPYFIKAKEITAGCFGEKSFEFLLTNIYIGRMYRYMNNYAEALKYYKVCHSVGTNGWTGRFPHEFTLYGELGKLYTKLSAPDSALLYAQKRLCYGYKGELLTINQIPPIPDRKNILRYYNSLLVKIKAYKQLYEKSGDTAILSVALEHCNWVNSLLCKMNEMSAEEFSGIRNSERVKTISSFAVYFSLQKYSTSNNIAFLRQAVEYSEVSKANYLKFIIANRAGAAIDSTQNRLMQQVRKLEGIQRGVNSNRFLSDSILMLKSQLLEAIITRNTGASIVETKAVEIPLYSPDSIQPNIPSGTSLVMYQIVDFSDDDDEPQLESSSNNLQLIAFCIDRDHIEHFSRPISSDDIKSMHSYVNKIKTGDISDFQTLGNILYGMLLKPFNQNLVSHRHVVIVSDSKMPDIPFECLPEIGTNHPLCNRLSISYHYSVALWNRSRNFAAANSNEPLNFIAIAPEYSRFPSSEVSTSVSDLDVERDAGTLMPLPMAKNEVTRIGNLLTGSGVDDVRVVKTGISKAMFKQFVKEYGMVHVAAHGFADMNDYRNSGIFFSATNSSGTNQNDFLSLNEIYDLETYSKLVVLSACKTSVGDRFKGEGTMALPRGFIYAGVPNVIASLWKVHDSKTKDLMVSFYTNLFEHKVTYSEALRLAKLECIAKGFLPIDWAGFIIVGE